jgi:lactate dehydrogenase-like 2-hydroxyacid dehydrogenase
LEYIGFWTNLYSHRINEAHARARGVHIDYIPDYGTDAVAEFVFAGIMELARKTQKRYVETKRGEWMYENLKTGSKIIVDPDQIEEWILRGKKLGIVGLGRIGRRVAEIAKFGFKLEVAYYSRTRKLDAESLGMKFMPLEDLFSWADIISCHLSPDAPEKMISQDLLERLQPKALFVNTGSGHSIDQEGLIKLLQQKRFSAFLDVYEGLPPRKELKDLPNVLFTYRAAWFTQQSIAYKAEQLISKMKGYLDAKAQQVYRAASSI